jgi:hypothetical protein
LKKVFVWQYTRARQPGIRSKTLACACTTRAVTDIAFSYESLPGVTGAATFDFRTIAMQAFEKQTPENGIDRSRNGTSFPYIHWGKCLISLFSKPWHALCNTPVAIQFNFIAGTGHQLSN